MPVKRLHYFHYQFLQENDFTDEQNYHLSMRRRHNCDFHTWGRVKGLDVSFAPGDRKVTISPGMAVDSLGREIVLESNCDVDLQSHAGESLYLVLTYKEGESDPTIQAGVSGNTRIAESYQTSVSAAPPADPSLNLILAKITLLDPGDPGFGAVKEVDMSVRTEAGAKIGEAKFAGLKLSVGNHGEGESPEILGVEVSAPGMGLQGIDVKSALTSFSDNVAVKGNLNVEGDLTIKGVVNKTNELTIKDNIIRVNVYKPPTATPLDIDGGMEVYRGGTAPNAQIIWDEGVDRWKIGTAENLVDVAYGPNWDSLTNNSVANTLHRHSELVTANGTVDPALSVDNAGNVGIGTASPTALFHVKNTKSSAVVKIEGVANTAGEGARLRWLETAVADYGVEALLDGGQDALIFRNIENNNVVNDNILVIKRVQGRVGIGKVPASELDVNGTVTATAFSGNGAVPRGVILMWYGTVNNIPAGWALCNGQNGTPDLRDRFVAAAGGSMSPGQFGEPDTHQHNHVAGPVNIQSSATGDHNHRLPENWYRRQFSEGGYTGIDIGGGSANFQWTNNAGNHAHVVNVPGIATSNSDPGGLNRPRWYALLYIMKL